MFEHLVETDKKCSEIAQLAIIDHVTNVQPLKLQQKRCKLLSTVHS